jgi:hypothetical protein
MVRTVSDETVECLGIQPVSQNVRRPSLEGRSTTSERLCPRNRTRERLGSAAQTIGPVHCRVRGHRSEVMFPVLAVGIAHGGRLSKMQSWRTCFSGCALRNRIALYRRSRSTCFRALLPAASGWLRRACQLIVCAARLPPRDLVPASPPRHQPRWPRFRSRPKMQCLAPHAKSGVDGH